jgi:hypothetical protein
MLGVRCASVTEALHLLEGVVIVKVGRGRVEVLDRDKLEEIAGPATGSPSGSTAV